MTELARRYAKALYACAPDAALEQVSPQLMSQPLLWQALISPAISAAEKKRVLRRLPDLSDGPLLRFYTLLADNDRMAMLPQIVQAFEQCKLQAQGVGQCVMRCAQRPDPAELEKLRQALCRLHGKRDLRFEIQTDPALLGGFTLELDGVRYDKSIRGALEQMRRQLEERRMV